MEKKLPVFYQNKEDCCGCAACCAICPLGLIEMTPDPEGFLYPTLTAPEKCLKCGQCLRVCPLKAE